MFDKKVRENAGAQTRARYDFQAHIAMLKIFDLHEQANEYRVILDHFDDVVVVEKSLTGDLIDFYQVKAKNGGDWTITALTRCKESAASPSSIIGKMYQNAVIFGEATRSIRFLSNAGFKVTDVDGKPFSVDTDRIAASAIHADEQQSIETALDSDFPPPRTPHCTGILFLERTPLSTTAQATFVTGRLVEMLSEIGEDENLPARAIYQTIYANVAVKSGRSGSYSSEDEFIADKAITRDDVTRVLQKAGATNRFRAWWPQLANEAAAAGYDTAQTIAFQNACLRYLKERAAGQFRPTRLGQLIASQLTSPIAGMVIGVATTISESTAAIAGETASDLIPIACVEILERLNEQGSKFISIANANTQSGAKE
jgi:hypothetical protein